MSVEDLIRPIVSYIIEPLVQFIAKELTYLLRPNNYVNKLNRLIQRVVNERNTLKKAADDASNRGTEVNPEVQLWLNSAGDIIDQAEDLLKDSNKRCFHGWCIDLGSRYKINKGAVEISESITKELGPIPKITSVARPPSPPIPEITSVARPPSPPPVLSDPNFKEFESTKETMRQIMEALKDAACGLVGVFGMGGIGKTTIVEKIAQKVKQDKQFDQVVTVVVSQSPDLEKIQDRLAFKLGLESDPRADVLDRASLLHKELMERLMNSKTILVILDDVWARFDLTKIGIPDHKGCKVMLTTRREDVCTSVGRGNGRKIKVGLLSKEESWELFKSNAGDGIDAPPLKEVAEMVMDKCQCLPLALKIVGQALHGKDIHVWRSAKIQLDSAITENIEGMSHGVISCLKLSYDYLNGNEAKVCFLTCCLFPEDFNIPIEMLVRYALGKGLFPYANTIDAARTLTQTTLGTLKDSCLLLEGDYKDGECVKVHDVVRDVGLSIASEAKLLSRSGPGFGRWLQLQLQSNSIEHIKGAFFATEEIVSLPEGIQCSELEDLCIVSENNMYYSDAFFQTMKKLKVLIHDGRSRLPTSLKCSVSLRTLHLVTCELGDISTALGELKMLEILTIKRTDIESLPVEVGQLRNLRLLDLMENNHLKRIPGNVISQLSQLEELYISEYFDDWKIEGTSGGVEKASLSELQSLPCLAILFVHVRDFAQFPPNLSLPNKLVKFEIDVGPNVPYMNYPTSRKLMMGVEKVQIEGVKSLLRMIDESREYKFTSYGNRSRYVLTDLAGGLNGLDYLSITVTGWISSLTSCVTTNNKVEPVFANLRDLELRLVWNLRGLASGGGIEGTATAIGGGVLPPGSLQHLKILEIHFCNRLEGWVVPFSWTHRLNSLEKVNISYCEKVEGLFEVEEETSSNSTNPTHLLSNLREISLSDMPQLRSLINGESSSIHFSNLKVLKIHYCKGLEGWKVPFSLAHRLHSLEMVNFRNCDNVKGLFEVEEENNYNSTNTAPLLSNLREIQLWCLPQLQSLTDGKSSSIYFSNLWRITIVECHKLDSVFTPNVVSQGLVHLEELNILECSGLKAIFEESDSNSSASQEIRTSSITTFPNLKKVYVHHCRHLKSIFRVSMAKDLPKLEHLRLIDNFELEELVCSNQNTAGAAAEENMEINDAQSSSLTWPQIRRIDIIKSRKFKRFCPRNCSIEIPLLQEFTHTNCSNWMKNFAADPPAHGLNIPQSAKINIEIEPVSSGNLPPGFDLSAPRSVYVGNIHRQVTQPLLEEVFSSTCGPVDVCKLIRKEKSSYGFVQYLDRRSAALAIFSLNGRHLFEQPIKVNWAYASGQREETSTG